MDAPSQQERAKRKQKDISAEARDVAGRRADAIANGLPSVPGRSAIAGDGSIGINFAAGGQTSMVAQPLSEDTKVRILQATWNSVLATTQSVAAEGGETVLLDSARAAAAAAIGESVASGSGGPTPQRAAPAAAVAAAVLAAIECMQINAKTNSDCIPKLGMLGRAHDAAEAVVEAYGGRAGVAVHLPPVLRQQWQHVASARSRPAAEPGVRLGGRGGQTGIGSPTRRGAGGKKARPGGPSPQKPPEPQPDQKRSASGRATKARVMLNL